MQRKSFGEILEEINRTSLEEAEPVEADTPEYGLVDSIDAEILMHRDAHFSGQFVFMLEHYHLGQQGCQPEFSLERIEALARWQSQQGEDIAPQLLSGMQAERVARARDAYRKLRAIYEMDGENTLPRLVADLVLSEDAEPDAEIAAIVEAGEAIVPHLLQLLNSDSFRDPLFPGYGVAPELAAECLGKIGAEQAVVPLFELIGRVEVELEECVLRALAQIAAPARSFLRKVLANEPITEDNERAALALMAMGPEEDVAQDCLRLLEKPAFLAQPKLNPHLVLGCEGLQEESERKRFAALLALETFPDCLRADAELIQRSWTKQVSG
jgi:hypothetical protein